MAEHYGIRWALGSDIGAGPYLSMFDVMRSFLDQNQSAGISVSPIKALYRSTLAGLEILDLAESKGRFAPGFQFDAIRLPIDQAILSTGCPVRIIEHLLGRALSRSDFDDLVLETILGGERVWQKDPSID
jgi:guanine deaminase